MTHSTLLTLLLTTPFAAAVLPLAQRLLPHLQQIARLLEDFRTQPVTPAATRDFELRLQELLRHVGLDLTDWTFNHLEPGPLPERLHHDGQRYRRRDPSPNTIATLCGPVCLWRQLYEDLEPGNPCLFPLERRLGVVAGAATPALAEAPAGGWPNIPRAARWTCWRATTTSTGRPRPYERSARPSPMAWRRSGPRPRSSRFWSGCGKRRPAAAATGRRWWRGVTAFTCPCARGRLIRRGRRRR